MNNKFCVAAFCSFLCLLFTMGQNVRGQNCIDIGGANPASVSQNFDGLGNSAGPQNSDAANIFILNPSAPRRYLGKFDSGIADNGGPINVPGWAIVEEGTNTSSVTGRFDVGNGSATGGNTFSFASTALPADRALGSLNDDAIATNFIGGCFRNTTGNTLTAVRIAYTGEMWRRGGNAAGDRLEFQYAVNATNTYSGTFNDFNALDFASPNLAGAAGARDGNDPLYRSVYAPTIMAVTLSPNDRLYVRWIDSNITGTDDGLAIDDFNIQLIPHTAAGVSVLGRILTADGRGISGARVTAESANGRTKTYMTNPFGYYRFEGISAGETYVFTVFSKRYQFAEPVRIVTVGDEISGFDFIALQ